MSMETALKMMNTAPVATEVAAPTPPQAAQETKVNETNGLQTREVDAPTIEATGVVEEPISPAEPTEAEKPVEAISAKFAALAKKERAIVKRQEETKAKEAQIKQLEAAVAAREAKVKESESLWDTDVFKALELKGYTYQKLTDMLLSGERAPKKEQEDPSTIATKAIESFRKEMADKEAARIAAEEAAKKEADEQQATAVAEAYEKYRQEVRDYTKEHKDDCELIEMYGQHELIVETVEGYYNTHKRVLSIKEASDMVEKYLLGEAQKALTSKKLAPQKSETPTAKEKVSAEENVRITKTLNNNMVPTAASILPAATEADRMRRALAALQAAK